MAQTPAVHKLRRAAHLLQTELLGRVSPSPNMVASEQAALKLRAVGRKHTTAAQVTFLIPLVGPDHVGDWGSVVQRLEHTLSQFVVQSNSNWTAIVCCQEPPKLPEDRRISWMSFADSKPGNDKWRKLRQLTEALPDHVTQPGYVMSFDADDLLRQGVVNEMLSRQDRGGYLVQSGYVMDVSTGDIALSDNRSLAAPMRKPFWKLCGSCAALYHDPRIPESTAFLAEMTQHEHRMFPYLARLAGQRLSPLSRPSVLYMLNHGENFGARRGRVSYKTRFVQRYKIKDAQQLKHVDMDFGLKQS